MNNFERILRIIFEGFNTQTKNYSNCILMMHECSFSMEKFYELVSSRNYVVCSDVNIDVLNRTLCQDAGGDFWDAYLTAESDGCSFTNFAEPSFSNTYYYNIPRFREYDFQNIIAKFGGSKIPETNTMTPDFKIADLVIELKDLQKDSLYNEDRRLTIAKIFESESGYSININYSATSGHCQTRYKRAIANSIKNIISKASKQIREYSKTNTISSAGVFLINTGYFSLDHQVFKTIVEDIITRDTNTIKFAYIFTQSVFHNAVGDLRADYKQDCIGKLPVELEDIYEACNILINTKMSSIFQDDNGSNSFVSPQYPISFFADNKIFYWKPERIEPSIEL